MKEVKFRRLTADEIEVRPAMIKDGKATMLLYIDSRSVGRLLDETVGPMGWTMEFTDVNGQVVGKMGIWDEEKGQWVYKSKRVKTKQEFVIPMQPKALSILQKYNHKLPIISNEKYNMYLKAAVKYAGIDKPVTTHWARHTGATILANNGVPMYIIQHILGHASIRETEKTYAKVLDSTIVDSMIEYQQRSNPSAEVKKCSIVNLKVTHGKVK